CAPARRSLSPASSSSGRSATRWPRWCSAAERLGAPGRVSGRRAPRRGGTAVFRRAAIEPVEHVVELLGRLGREDGVAYLRLDAARVEDLAADEPRPKHDLAGAYDARVLVVDERLG